MHTHNINVEELDITGHLIKDHFDGSVTLYVHAWQNNKLISAGYHLQNREQARAILGH